MLGSSLDLFLAPFPDTEVMVATTVPVMVPVIIEGLHLKLTLDSYETLHGDSTFLGFLPPFSHQRFNRR